MGKIRNLIIDAGTALLWGFMFRRNSGRRWADEFSDAQICRRVCEHRPPLQRLVSQKCFCGVVGWDQTEEKKTIKHEEQIFRNKRSNIAQVTLALQDAAMGRHK